MGSTRLPGKVMLNIEGKKVLEHVIDRVSNSKLINEVVVATTTSEQDNVIVDFLKNKNISFYRGSENNVLERYYLATKKFNGDIIVRITSDCPLVDYRLIDKMLKIYLESNFDYYSNTIERTFPRGLDIEIFSLKSLEKAHKEAVLESEKEHVTPFIWMRNKQFRIGQYKNRDNNNNLRITLDTIEDLEVIKDVYKKFYNNKYIEVKDVIEYLSKLGDKVANYCIEQKKFEQELFLRDIDVNDVDILWNLRNNEVTREYSLNTRYILYEEHIMWFENRDLVNNKYYVLINENQIVGNIYFIKKTDFYEINYSIDSKFRGMGYGKKILELGQKNMNGKVILGKVKESNKISQKIFEGLGYEKTLLDNEIIYTKKI